MTTTVQKVYLTVHDVPGAKFTVARDFKANGEEVETIERMEKELPQEDCFIFLDGDKLKEPMLQLCSRLGNKLTRGYANIMKTLENGTWEQEGDATQCAMIPTHSHYKFVKV